MRTSLTLRPRLPQAPATHPLEQWRAFRRVLHQIDNVADAITAADPQATLNNVVDVTVQFNASSETATSAVIQELYTITDATTGSLQVGQPVNYLQMDARHACAKMSC